MPNSFPLPQATAQFAQSLRARSLATRVVNTSLDNVPAGIGDTLNIRFAVAQSPADVSPGFAPTAAQDVAPTTVSLVINKFKERSMVITDKERAEIEAGFVPQAMTQMAIDLATQVNTDIYTAAVQGAGWSVGTAGTNPFATDEKVFLSGLQRLDELYSPLDGRVAILNPSAYYAALSVPNFVQAERRGQAAGPLLTGNIGNGYGSDIALDQLIPNQTTGAVGAGSMTANGVNAAGSFTISIAKGAGANWSAAVGDIISIAGQPQTYVVAAAATVTAGANTTVTLTSGLKVATAGGEAITLTGSASSYKNSLIMNRMGVMFASRPLNELTVDGINPAERYVFNDPLTGLSMRAELERQQYQTKLKFAILYGVKVVRPDMVGRLIG